MLLTLLENLMHISQRRKKSRFPIYKSKYEKVAVRTADTDSKV